MQRLIRRCFYAVAQKTTVGDVDPCSLALPAVTSVAEYIFGGYDLHVSRATCLFDLSSSPVS
jgi:hypothetical protein